MKRTDGLLMTGVVIGILVALAGLVDAGTAPLDDATAARVNGVAIPADELRSLLERRARDGAPVDQLLGTLDDMIDEELLIQRAAELGILRRDSNVRVAIIQAMEKNILNEARGRTFSEAELRAFYGANRALFSEPRALQVEEVIVTDGAQVAAVTAALEEGADLAALARQNPALSVVRLPPVPLSLDALARRLPGAVVARLETAEEGAVLAYESGRGQHLLRVGAVLDERVPPFEDARISVLNELQVRGQDEAYDDYLAWLRQRADIRTNDSLAP